MTVRRLLFSALFLYLLSFSFHVRAQKSIRDSTITVGLASVGYQGLVPMGEMAKLYGYTNQVGAEMGVKFRRGWTLSGGGYFLFGESVNGAEILKNISFLQNWQNDDGSVYSVTGLLDGYGAVTTTGFGLRGFSIPIRFGKVFQKIRLGYKNPNSGLFIELGAQFIQYKIQMDLSSDLLPYLDGAYQRGYDRLTNGIGLTGSLGYRFFSNNRAVNFYVAFECNYNFVKNRRGFNFDTRQPDDDLKQNIMLGFRAGWVLPIYRAAPNKYYYY